MRQPRKRGRAIDNHRIAGWVRRFAGYRQEVSACGVQAWLEQFDQHDRDLAARILDCVTYVTDEQIEGAFRSTLDHLPGWSPNKSARTGKWRFVAYSRAAGESGDAMLHRLRSAVGLTSARHHELFIGRSDLLREDLGPEDTVVFVDDFAGTGRQVSVGWKEVMKELLPGEPRVFLVLVATSAAAKQRIEEETELQVRSRLVLTKSDDVFSRQCKHFSHPERELLLRYCRRANKKNPKGFGDCGFVLILAHKAPNNSIPVLHATHDRWRGLFPRS